MKLLLFDIDGTLVRAGGSGRKALNQAAYRLFGKREVCSEFNLAGRTDLWNFREAARLALGRRPSPAQTAALRREYLRRLPYYVRKACRERTYVLPRGIRGLLRRLSREPEVLLGLGTGNLEEGARLKLGPSGFNRYFAFGGFGSDALDRAAILRRGVRRERALLNGNARGLEVFVIVDTPHDVSAGRRAGYKTIAVGTGYAAWKDLIASRPGHLARDFRGINSWLRRFGIKTRSSARPRRRR